MIDINSRLSFKKILEKKCGCEIVNCYWRKGRPCFTGNPWCILLEWAGVWVWGGGRPPKNWWEMLVTLASELLLVTPAELMLTVFILVSSTTSETTAGTDSHPTGAFHLGTVSTSHAVHYIFWIIVSVPSCFARQWGKFHICENLDCVSGSKGPCLGWNSSTWAVRRSLRLLLKSPRNQSAEQQVHFFSCFWMVSCIRYLLTSRWVTFSASVIQECQLYENTWTCTGCSNTHLVYSTIFILLPLQKQWLDGCF